MERRIDRISNLPDDVLTRILSFVTARQAVQTCVLSKRWRNTWASVSILNFDFDEFWADHSDECAGIDENAEEELKFVSFVSNVLENREPSHLDTVIIRGDFGDHFMDPFIGWLDRAALLMPRVICAEIPEGGFGEELNLPDSVFSCSRLENLELYQRDRGFLVIKQNSVALSSLKTLKLGCLQLDDNFVQKLLLGCPALETLIFSDCYLPISDISSNVLRKLTLDYCWHSRHMRISCPVLVSLIICSQENINKSISFENMASLVNACINIYEDDNLSGIDFDTNPKFLSGLSNATSLELCVSSFDPYYKELWVKDISNCRTFFNLKKLDIGAWIEDFSLVACFLRHSPVLEHLTLRLNQSDGLVQQMSEQDVSIELEYLETVDIFCEEKTLANKLRSVLGRYVETIGNFNIREQ
ncbi:F-box family protein [Rhynchospora pubera]|uniref:F-box family protein n=1 Tax=Rhynchospora pubera TaxID=906938 RepID=A0AAV8DVR5_9POAL|nr:F-box family protein [Rhynchospora pubera]